MAVENVLRWPPESFLTRLSTWGVRSRSSRTSAMRWRRSALVTSLAKHRPAAYSRVWRTVSAACGVVLGHHADAVAHDGIVLVDVQAVVEDLALLGLLLAGECLEQRGLACAQGPTTARRTVAGQGEDGVEQPEVVAHREREVLAHEGSPALPGPVPWHSPSGLIATKSGADADDHRLGHQDRRDALGAEVDAVGGTQVRDPDALWREVDRAWCLKRAGR